jgi:anhydro-N-acetylmuramic acid kinase
VSPWEFARRYSEKPERLVIGLMSGTSVDGVDAALVRLSGSGRQTRAELLRFLTIPFPADLRESVLSLSHGQGDAERVSTVNVALGRLFASAAGAVADRSGIETPEIDLVASHGQTISHTPQHHATLQIGDGAIIATQTGLPVVSDFRTADMALGGQGAPLVPYADWCLLTHPTKARAVQNIGGIGNVTYLPSGAEAVDITGFDTGPGNMLIDRAAEWVTGGAAGYDLDGKLGAASEPNTDLLSWLLDHPFLLREPPKSAGREEFGEAFWVALLNRVIPPSGRKAPWVNLEGYGWVPPMRLPNAVELMSTLTAFTALSIADAYERFLPRMPDEVIVGGGGVRNPTLMRMLRERLAPIPVLTHEDIGINSDAKEAIAFAILANETILGNPSNLPSVTGARRPVLLGKITLP